MQTLTECGYGVTIPFAANAHAPRYGREYTRGYLACVSAEVRDATEMIVSELVTNAVQATFGRHMIELLIAIRSESDVWVGVVDTATGSPVLKPADGLAADGRGLEIVDALSTEWGWFRMSGGCKTVWASVGFGD